MKKVKDMSAEEYAAARRAVVNSRTENRREPKPAMLMSRDAYAEAKKKFGLR